MLYIITSAAARQRAADDVLRIKKPGLCVEIKPYVKNRSAAQNRLYWMWVGILAEHIGMDKDEAHDTFRLHFLAVVDRVVGGVQLRELRSTGTLSTDEFTQYLNKLQAYAAREEVKLPIPHDYGYAMGFEDEPKGKPRGR